MASESTVAEKANVSETHTEAQYFGSWNTVVKFCKPTHWLLPPNGGSSVTAQ